MARPIKKGLDYFPIPTDFMSDRTVRRIRRRANNEAVLLYITLLCDIYKNGYSLSITDNYLFDLSDQFDWEERKIEEYIQLFVEMELFHAPFWEKQRLLTSEEIQQQYFFVKGKKFDKQTIPEELCLVKPQENEVFPEKSTQSIAKESKEKNILRESECARTRENWDDWKNELLNDEDWRASVVRQSGQGIAFNSRLPQLLDDFCDFLISVGETETAKEKKDFVRRFAYWCKNLCHEEKKMIIRQNRKTEPVSRIEELNRVGEESLVIARQMLLGDGFRI